MILLEFSVKIMNLPVLREKVGKKLQSHARVGFSEGCKSVTFNKGLGRVSPPWGGILPNYSILVEMGGISPHFMKMG